MAATQHADTQHADIQATLDHMAMIDARRKLLTTREEEARAQLTHRLGLKWRAGEVSAEEVYAVYKQLQAFNLPGLFGHWDGAGLPTHQALARRKTGIPNRPDGGWEGARFNDVWPGPLEGQCVVYVLYDGENQPCYVGSTKHLQQRVGAHRKDKSFAYWIAWPCQDRKDAYRREDAMLREFAPYLNRRASA